MYPFKSMSDDKQDGGSSGWNAKEWGRGVSRRTTGGRKTMKMKNVNFIRY